MRRNKIIFTLALIIIPLALLAAGAGIFWKGSGTPFPFTTLRGETVMIRGHGLYIHDTVNSSSQETGQDVVTLAIGIPLLAIALILARRGSLRGRLLLTGALGYFLYTYAAMSFLTAFNALYLVYVALFSLSLFGFILSIKEIDPNEVVKGLAEGFPRRTISVYFIVVAAFLSLAWLKLVVPSMIGGTPPAGLESAITMVIQSLDLGVIVPTSLITAILLLQKKAWGYTLAVVVLLKILTMGSALIAMIIGQILAKVTIDPVTSVFFVLISLSGILLGMAAFKNIRPGSQNMVPGIPQ